MSDKKVTSYDAQYLLFAQKEKCNLLTFDRELLKIRDLTIDIDQLLLSIRTNGKKANLSKKRAV